MKNIGLSSFAYRYNIGFSGFMPEKPMDSLAFLKAAYENGFSGVQLCENLGIAQADNNQLKQIKALASELGLFLEVGMNTVTAESIVRHLEIAKTLSASFLRIVLVGPRLTDPRAVNEACDKYTAMLSQTLSLAKKYGISMGLENHFDLPTYALKNIVETINDNTIGLIVDTTNAIHFLERPEETLSICEGHIVSIHLKDYLPQKVEAGHFISGTILGQGDLNPRPFINACDNIIMEMTVRRLEGYTIPQVLEWEHHAVATSAKMLLELCKNNS